MSTSHTGVSRRNFIQSLAAAGAGVALAGKALGQAAPAVTTGPALEPINVAIVGVGRQGKILLDLALKIPGLRFKAVCDIWAYSQKIGAGLCKQSGHEVKVYEDFNEMLASEKDLQAVIVATPDLWHAPITNACLKAGLHVYCEKEMSNTLEAAKSMVLTARETKKLLQIGHQRRSNPYYKHAYNLMHKEKFCGVVNVVNGQWNQLKPFSQLSPRLLEKFTIPAATLNKYGYDSMAQFYDWRWFKSHAGGPMTDLGSHQVDIFNWFLDAVPTSVYAVGSLDRAVAEAKAKEVGYVPTCFDKTLAMYEWKTKEGIVYGYYQVNLCSSYGGFFEVFEGDGGTMVTAEIKERAAMFKEAVAKTLDWENEAETFEKPGGDKVMHFDPLKSRKAQGRMDAQAMALAADLEKPAHQPHLENFFNTIRGKDQLTCPAEIGYETAVTVLKANESAVTGKKIEFKPEEFKV